MSSKTAFQSFSLENDILQLTPQDEIYKFDSDANKEINRLAPWTKEFAIYFSCFVCSMNVQPTLFQDLQDLCRCFDQNGLGDLREA